MKKLTERELDVIRVKTMMMEEAMWQAARRDSYVYREKISISKLLDNHPKLVILSVAPIMFIVMSLVAEMFN